MDLFTPLCTATQETATIVPRITPQYLGEYPATYPAEKNEGKSKEGLTMKNSEHLLLETAELVDVLGMLEYTMQDSLQCIDLLGTDEETQKAVHNLYAVSASLRMLAQKAEAVHGMIEKESMALSVA